MTLLLGIPFDFQGMTYYRCEREVNLGDLIVCQTPHGTYMGRVAKIRKPTEEEEQKKDFNTIFPMIDRIASEEDKSFQSETENREKEISARTQKEADKMNLGMKILKSYLSIDEDKVLVTFFSDGRVDFRELVKTLNSYFRLKIELRQIGPRDEARLIGGIGPCGLPLCCATFLSAFDGISIAMAKNQLLAINIPKLSGQCGKLMCCLKYEDKAYAEIRPLFPKMGEKIEYKNSTYSVIGMNILSETITLYNGDNYESFSREEFDRVKKGLAKSTAVPTLLSKDINAGVDLSGKGIQDTNDRLAKIKASNEQHKDDNRNKNRGNVFSSSSRPTGSNDNRYSSNNSSRNHNNNNHNGNSSYNRNGQNNNNNNGSNNSRDRQNNNNNRSNQHTNSYSSHTGYRQYGSHHTNNTPTNNNGSKKDSGFIPVSQIADKSVLNTKPVKDKNDKK